MSKSFCEICEKNGCHGECQNYILDMILNHSDRNAFNRLFMEIPKFNYVLNEKINSIFGTDLEVAIDGNVDEEKTKLFNQLLYSKNKNGNTNISEIKRAEREKEIFGIGYLFIDGINLYALREDEISSFQENDDDPIINNIIFYSVGNIDVPERLTFPKAGYIKQDSGYIISPNNIIKFSTDTFAMNSDLKQLQILLEINRKIYESTSKRDYGDLFLFTTAPQTNIVSSIAIRVKDGINDAIVKMRERVAKLIKKNKVDDSNIVVLDDSYKDVKQIAPVTKVKDYQFIWESQDEIISSIFNFPMLLAGLGDEAGNVSKEALLKEARANTLTPIKNDTANALSTIAKQMFGDKYYLRFKDYEEVTL